MLVDLISEKRGLCRDEVGQDFDGGFEIAAGALALEGDAALSAAHKRCSRVKHHRVVVHDLFVEALWGVAENFA